MCGTVQALRACLRPLNSSLNKTEALAFIFRFSILFPVRLIYLTFPRESLCFLLSFCTLFFKFYFFIICPLIRAVFVRNRLLRYGAASRRRRTDYANPKILRKYKKLSGINFFIRWHTHACVLTSIL